MMKEGPWKEVYNSKYLHQEFPRDEINNLMMHLKTLEEVGKGSEKKCRAQ